MRKYRSRRDLARVLAESFVSSEANAAAAFARSAASARRDSSRTAASSMFPARPNLGSATAAAEALTDIIYSILEESAIKFYPGSESESEQNQNFYTI